MTSSYEDQLMTIKEAAAYLSLSAGTLYHFVSQGRIPVVKISSRCIRFRKSDLINWIEEKVAPAARVSNGGRG